MDELPVRIEGFDISNLGPSTRSPRWWSSRAERRRGPTTALQDPRRRRARRAARRLRGDGGGADAAPRALTEQADLSPHDAERDESFASLPDLIVIDGGKGQLWPGMRALEPLTERG